MSGIGGIFQRDRGPVDPTHLGAMLERLIRRGPDARGTWRQGPLGLAQTQLWSTPESLSEQLPLVSGDLALVMDGRIDNRSELIPQLDDLRALPAAEIADSQVVLGAYRKWGLDCLPLLFGDFAFAIWDAARQQLFCARDVFGVRPFYYFCDGDRFAFGSEIKALLALPFVPRDLREGVIAEYMIQEIDDKVNTFYAHILRLPPASYLLVGPDQIQIQCYWALDPDREVYFKNSQEYGEAYRELFVNAVHARLRSVYPIGTALSGGLDSSAVTGISGRYLHTQGKLLDTFSVIFDDVPASDERPFMQAVLDQGYYRPHYVHGDQSHPVGYIDTFLSEQDQPFAAPNLFIDYEMWKIASQQGMRVFLEGLFGDNIVSHGYPLFKELARAWRLWSLYRQLRPLARTQPELDPTMTLMRKFIFEDGIKAHIPPSVMGVYRRLRGRPGVLPVYISRILEPAYAQSAGLTPRLQQAAEEVRMATTARKMHLRDLKSWLIPMALEIYSAGSATFSLDVRFSYIDRRFAEFCLAIPAAQKLENGYGRMVARRGMQGVLPEQICWRTTKGNLSHNLVYLLKSEQGKLKEIFSASGNFLQGYLNMPVLQKWLERVCAGQGNEEQVLSVYQAAILACWLSSRDGVQNGAEGGGRMPRTATI